MRNWKYIFLTLALAEFAIGFSESRPATFYFLGRPLGATLFGLFLIAQILEKESILSGKRNRATVRGQTRTGLATGTAEELS